VWGLKLPADASRFVVACLRMWKLGVIIQQSAMVEDTKRVETMLDGRADIDLKRLRLKQVSLAKSAVQLANSAYALVPVGVALFALSYASYHDTFFSGPCHCYCGYLRICTPTPHVECSLGQKELNCSRQTSACLQLIHTSCSESLKPLRSSVFLVSIKTIHKPFSSLSENREQEVSAAADKPPSLTSCNLQHLP